MIFSEAAALRQRHAPIPKPHSSRTKRFDKGNHDAITRLSEALHP